MKALVVFSGGQDSTTCLYDQVDRLGPQAVHTLSINYGQRHVRELMSADMVADMAAIPRANRHAVRVPDVLQGTSPLTNRKEQLEQYQDHQSLPGGLEKTFVPARNQFFLTIAANIAYVNGLQLIVTGVSQEDYGGYPDCRREFIDALEKAINLGLESNIKIVTPLVYLTKADTVKMAMRIPGCFEALAYTHTAYDGSYPPVSRDHANLLRQKGFEQAGVPDPLVVRAIRERLMPVPDGANYHTEAAQTYIRSGSASQLLSMVSA
jgi:7-cyano-7-deazaguanine synthase